MPEVDLATLADAGAFVTHEHQTHLAEAVRIGEWHVDAAASAFRFTDGDGAEHRVRAHFIGTSSPEDGTWLWAWQNLNDFPQPFVRQAEKLRDLGVRSAIAEFTSASLPLTDALPSTLMRAVATVTGLSAHYSAPTGTGATRAWLLLDDPALALPAPTVIRTVAVITSALSSGTAVDHRRALTGWARQRGVGETRVDDALVELTLPDGSLQVRFDDDDRILGLGRRLGTGHRKTPSPEPQAPPAEPAQVGAEADRARDEAADPLDEAAGETPQNGPRLRRRTFVDRLLGRP